MNEIVFWIWNGWAILFIGIIAIAQFFHIYFPIQLKTHQFRLITGGLITGGVICSFIFSGIIVGSLSIIIGPGLGIILAKVFIKEN